MFQENDNVIVPTREGPGWPSGNRYGQGARVDVDEATGEFTYRVKYFRRQREGHPPEVAAQ